MAEKFTHSASEEAENPGFRKPYQRPSIISRERLETAANVCTGFGLKSQPGEPAPDGGECGQVGYQS